MTISDHSLHFILDAENDVHYTDCLLTLDSAQYIWYLLRRNGRFQNILLLRLDNADQLCIDVYDSESEQLLQRFRKPLFARRNTSGQVTAARFPELWLFEDELLQELLDVKSKDGRQTALVFTQSAFERVCSQASEKSSARLLRLLSAPADQCAIFIRLSYQPEELEKLLLLDQQKSPLLAKTYKLIRTGAGDQPVPLSEAMAAVLGNQLLQLDDQPREMLHLLMKLAVTDASSGDTLSALEDQAEYLEQCRICRIGVFQPPRGSEQELYTPVSRRQAEAWLRIPSNREKLRRCTPLQQLPAAPPLPAYDDDLARKALGLSLRDDCRQKAVWDVDLYRIKRNLITLWDKPRNPEAVEMAESLCRSARSAISKQNWLCMEELLELLRFFSMPEQLCASKARWDALEHIRRKSQDLISQCNYIHNKYSFAAAEGFAAISNMGIDAGDMAKLKNLHEIVAFDLRYFDRPDSSQRDGEDIEEYHGRVQQILESGEKEIAAWHEHQSQQLRDQSAAERADDSFSITPEALETTAASVPRSEPVFEPDDTDPFFSESPFTETYEDESPPTSQFSSSDASPFDPNKYLEERKHRNSVPLVYSGEDDYL